MGHTIMTWSKSVTVLHVFRLLQLLETKSDPKIFLIETHSKEISEKYDIPQYEDYNFRFRNLKKRKDEWWNRIMKRHKLRSSVSEIPLGKLPSDDSSQPEKPVSDLPPDEEESLNRALPDSLETEESVGKQSSEDSPEPENAGRRRKRKRRRRREEEPEEPASGLPPEDSDSPVSEDSAEEL